MKQQPIQNQENKIYLKIIEILGGQYSFDEIKGQFQQYVKKCRFEKEMTYQEIIQLIQQEWNNKLPDQSIPKIQFLKQILEKGEWKQSIYQFNKSKSLQSDITISGSYSFKKQSSYQFSLQPQEIQKETLNNIKISIEKQIKDIILFSVQSFGNFIKNTLSPQSQYTDCEYRLTNKDGFEQYLNVQQQYLQPLQQYYDTMRKSIQQLENLKLQKIDQEITKMLFQLVLYKSIKNVKNMNLDFDVFEEIQFNEKQKIEEVNSLLQQQPQNNIDIQILQYLFDAIQNKENQKLQQQLKDKSQIIQHYLERKREFNDRLKISMSLLQQNKIKKGIKQVKDSINILCPYKIFINITSENMDIQRTILQINSLSQNISHIYQLANIISYQQPQESQELYLFAICQKIDQNYAEKTLQQFINNRQYDQCLYLYQKLNKYLSKDQKDKIVQQCANNLIFYNFLDFSIYNLQENKNKFFLLKFFKLLQFIKDNPEEYQLLLQSQAIQIFINNKIEIYDIFEGIQQKQIYNFIKDSKTTAQIEQILHTIKKNCLMNIYLNQQIENEEIGSFNTKTCFDFYTTKLQIQMNRQFQRINLKKLQYFEIKQQQTINMIQQVKSIIQKDN